MQCNVKKIQLAPLWVHFVLQSDWHPNGRDVPNEVMMHFAIGAAVVIIVDMMRCFQKEVSCNIYISHRKTQNDASLCCIMYKMSGVR